MSEELRLLSSRIAEAIRRRDTAELRTMLAPEFVQRSQGSAPADVESFLEAVEQIPGTIVSVRLDGLAIDETPFGALVTGTQHAQVIVDGVRIEDERYFVDWFVRIDGHWRLQAAADVPLPSPPPRS